MKGEVVRVAVAMYTTLGTRAKKIKNKKVKPQRKQKGEREGRDLFLPIFPFFFQFFFINPHLALAPRVPCTHVVQHFLKLCSTNLENCSEVASLLKKFAAKLLDYEQTMHGLVDAILALAGNKLQI